MGVTLASESYARAITCIPGLDSEHREISKKTPLPQRPIIRIAIWMLLLLQLKLSPILPPQRLRPTSTNNGRDSNAYFFRAQGNPRLQWSQRRNAIAQARRALQHRAHTSPRRQKNNLFTQRALQHRAHTIPRRQTQRFHATCSAAATRSSDRCVKLGGTRAGLEHARAVDCADRCVQRLGNKEECKKTIDKNHRELFAYAVGGTLY